MGIPLPSKRDSMLIFNLCPYISIFSPNLESDQHIKASLFPAYSILFADCVPPSTTIATPLPGDITL